MTSSITILPVFRIHSQRTAMLNTATPLNPSNTFVNIVNQGSDMAVFGIAGPNTNDEVPKFQRYVNCNEAIWGLFSFPIHERYLTTVHLAAHFENGQRVHFTEANAAQKEERPPATTLTHFYSTCKCDLFARILLYSEIPPLLCMKRCIEKVLNIRVNIRDPTSFDSLRIL